MKNIDDIIRGFEDEIRRYKAEVKRTLDAAEQGGRANLSDADETRCEDLMSRAEAIYPKLERAKAVKTEDEQLEKRLNERTKLSPGTAKPAYDRVMRVGNEARQYNKGNDPNGKEFLRDVVLGTVSRDPSAAGRLERHMQEERVERHGNYQERAAGDIATTGLGGLVVPQYLLDLTAPAVANMRPLANVANHHDLPEAGMTLTIPKITTATSAALQASQLSAVSSTSIAETDLNVTVQTAAGSQNVSRQAVERGTGIDDLVMQDLLKRVATVLDFNLINQATNGMDTTAVTCTYTSASPTGVEFYPYIFKANSLLEQALLGAAPVDYLVVHPRRWSWLASQTSSQWPFLQAMGGPVATQGFAVAPTNAYGAGVRGILANGLKVCVDANVPTTENATQDPAFVIASQEVHLWEPAGGAVMIRAEQPNVASLGILLVAYEYFAFTNARYANAQEKIIGSGMAAPAGF